MCVCECECECECMRVCVCVCVYVCDGEVCISYSYIPPGRDVISHRLQRLCISTVAMESHW